MPSGSVVSVGSARKFVCPCCHGHAGTMRRRVGAEEAATHHVRPWADGPRNAALADHIRKLWGGDWCEIVDCNACGAATAVPFVAGDSQFYELAYGHTDWYPAYKWEFREALRLLGSAGQLPRDLRVLEIGAGRGAFLRQIIARGVDPSGLAAVEYSTLARRSLVGLGIGHVSDEPLSSSGVPPEWQESFHVVALFQVLEHLDDLDAKLELLRAWLCPDGRLLVAVPNQAWIRTNELNGALLDQPPTHITCFTSEALAA